MREPIGADGCARGTAGARVNAVLRLVPLALWLAVAGCGHRGSPVPPLPRLPDSPREPVLRQRADRLEIAATYHLTALEGRKLKPPVAPVLLYVVPRLPEDTTGWDTPAREREFGREARKHAFDPFPPSEFGKTVARNDSVPLPELSTKGPIVIAVALRDKSALSFASRRLVFVPATPPIAPLVSFTAVPEEKGIRLSWVRPDDARVGSVHIYRFRPGEPEPREPWRIVPAGDTAVLDETAHYGEDVVYAAAAALADKAVPVESAVAHAGPIAYRDVFPPLPPSAVDAVAETGRVRVFWYPGGSPDEAASTVERQAEGEAEFHVIGTVDAPESFLLDEKVTPGVRYRYRVTTRDKSGNQAAPAGPTEWVSPRPPEAR